MDLDISWLLLGLPLAFAAGWVASRLDLRQLKRERDDSPRAYFKGLNLLLNEQQDQAIDAFIETVQNDPDSTELHFALGKLFRRRGEFERAVRVHRHLLSRGDLPVAERWRAQLALAQDYMKAGLFDRAEAAWRALQGSPHDSEARLALLSLYERAHDWTRAAETARQLEALGQGRFAARIAHYECEQAEAADAEGRPEQAEAALQRARAAAPDAVRPLLLAGRRALRQQRPQQALQHWQALHQAHPASFPLVAADYAVAALACGQADAARATLREALQQRPSVELLQALQQLDADARQADAAPHAGRHRELIEHLASHPTLPAALLLLDSAPAPLDGAARDAVRAAVARAAQPLQRYRCAACGFEARHYFWQCPGCLAWDSFPPQRVESA